MAPDKAASVAENGANGDIMAKPVLITSMREKHGKHITGCLMLCTYSKYSSVVDVSRCVKMGLIGTEK